MLDKDYLPNISILFEGLGGSRDNSPYSDIARHALKKMLPPSLQIPHVDDPDLLSDQQLEFSSLLPLFYVTPCNKVPANISFFIVSKLRTTAFQFFFEMISHWLVPGKRLNVILLYAVDFRYPELGSDDYTLCEVMVNVNNQEEFEELQRNLPIIETEICLGMQSSYYARRILEIKGLAIDAKTTVIQDYVASLINRMPRVFDSDLMTEMQHVLVMCTDEFKVIRECRHLSRIISVHYLFRKSIREAARNIPEKRHLSLKLFRSVLHMQEEDKPVLSVVVGFNFLRDKEVFEERHLLSAIQNYIPTAHAVEHSFFASRRGTEPICTFYLEIEKTNGEIFTADEIRLLRQELPTDLKDRIEHLMHPIFMPRNEEEVMRNILSLSNQIKYIHDLPQVIISFDQQTYNELFFTIIMLRVMKPGCASIQTLFNNAQTPLGYIHDRTKSVGFLRKKYAKEAVVFGVSLAKDQFLRRDHSIDLNKARQTVAQELVKVVGEVRDFNGGLITKQNELLYAFREELNDVKYNELLLENFFYSLIPDIMRNVLDAQTLKTWFLLLLETIDTGFFAGANYVVKIQTDAQHVYTMVKTEDRSQKDALDRSLSRFDELSTKLGSSFVSVYEISYIGYLFLCDDLDEQELFCQTLQSTLANTSIAVNRKH